MRATSLVHAPGAKGARSLGGHVAAGHGAVLDDEHGEGTARSRPRATGWRGGELGTGRSRRHQGRWGSHAAGALKTDDQQ